VPTNHPQIPSPALTVSTEARASNAGLIDETTRAVSGLKAPNRFSAELLEWSQLDSKQPESAVADVDANRPSALKPQATEDTRKCDGKSDIALHTGRYSLIDRAP